MKISIITVCFNSAKTIERTIKSVLNQKQPVHEYIIVDGASTDGTLEIVRSYEGLFHGRMIVISEPDHGIYDAMNKGIRLATGDVIGIINSDDYYELDTTDIITKRYDGSEYAVLYGAIREWNGENAYESFLSHENIQNEMIHHPTCFITRKTYVDFGVFDLQYAIVADYDLILRFSKNPQVIFIPIQEVLANFTVGGVSYSRKAYYERLRMEVNHGLKSKRDAFVLLMKAKISAIWKKSK